jgi:hypothetical protein
MATRATIDRLCSRISRISDALNPPRPKVVAVEVPHGMDENAVVARHHQVYPQDKHAELTVCIRRFDDSDADAPYREHEDPKISRAWRELARELQATRH